MKNILSKLSLKSLGIYAVLLLVAGILYTLTVRGNFGVPNPQEIAPTSVFQSGTPFESSQEGSRYAMVLSLYHDRSFNIDNYISLGMPDVGKINGHYFSLFPPGASITAIPLYALGLKLNATQFLTFMNSTIFATLTMILIIRFMKRLGAPNSAALFAAIAFGFATNAWGYSVTLVAHLLSGFLVLLALYLMTFNKAGKLWKIILVWILYSIAVFVDFPNLFLFLPIVGLMSLRFFAIAEGEDTIGFRLRWKYLFAPVIFIALMCGYGYYNYVQFGAPTVLSNALPRVTSTNGIVKEPETKKEKSPFEVLKTRNSLDGFASFLISRDRSLLVYSPVVFLFIFGLTAFRKMQTNAKVALVAVPLVCLVLYSMFPDPYGGWAFGSRYMIASMPALCILAGMGLWNISKQARVKAFFGKVVYSLVFIYSAAVSLLAPLTTNIIPPFVEARFLGLESTYVINWRMLERNELNSFFYNHIVQKNISGVTYYGAILFFVLLLGIFLIWYPHHRHEN